MIFSAAFYPNLFGCYREDETEALTQMSGFDPHRTVIVGAFREIQLVIIYHHQIHLLYLFN